MKINILLYTFICLLISEDLSAQAITSVPSTPTINDEVTVRFDINQCTRKDLLGFTGDVYVHTGVKVSRSTQWEYVVADWDVNIAKAKCTRISTNVYEISLNPNPKDYYGIANSDTVTGLAFVVRSSDGGKQTEDLFLTVYEPGLTVELIEPTSNIIITEGTEIEVNAKTVAIGTAIVDSIMLYIDDSLYHTSKFDTLKNIFVASGIGKHWIKVVANNPEYSVSDSLFYFVRDDINEAELPQGIKYGINYVDSHSVTLALLAPNKQSIFIIGDFNNWEPDNAYLMNRTANDSTWWFTIDGLTAGEEYAFQYFIDGDIRVADPYSEKVLDQWNDKYISSATYPNLKEYPEGKTTNIVGIIQTAQPVYEWKVNDFAVPASANLVIYEMHVQNFTEAANIKAVTDTLDYLEQLGINAIELMPVNEFEGNLSWGYNPSFYFAFDKTYGTKNDLKQFIDECHSRGIAVFTDLVLNHSYSQSPLVQMYWDGSNVTSESPWYNVSCPHSSWCWGYDFNHESKATQYFVDRVTEHWLTEYNIDGFRFDFTKGFTNTPDANAWGPDASRIAILKRMSDAIWAVKPGAKVIFEHLAENSEEKELSDYGILLWGNMNQTYNEATMGYNESNKSNFSRGVYSERGWDVPGLVTYMESHDEERLMYKNIQYGNSNSEYNIKDLATGLKRIETAAAFFFTIPGPKMIWMWGELGYDYSINTCTDGSVDNCRLDLKPIRWDYYNDSKRYRLYKVFEALIDFKKTEYCGTNDFDYNFTGELKTLHLNLPAASATIIGNFGITEGSVNPVFQHTGTWYDYMSGESFEVSDANAQITLSPGEYHIYTDVQLPKPDVPEVSVTDQILDNSVFNLYPNPVIGDLLYINYNVSAAQNVGIELFNISGELLYSSDIQIDNKGTFSIDLNNLDPQIIIYNIATRDNNYTGRISIY